MQERLQLSYRRILLQSIAILMCLGPVDTIVADTIVVTTTADTVAADGFISIREAFIEASANGVDDEIVLTAASVYQFSDCALGSFELTEATRLVVQGNGALLQKSCVGDDPVMQLFAGSDFVLEDLDMTGNGSAGVIGGGAAIDGAGGTGIFSTIIINDSLIQGFAGSAAVHGGSDVEITLAASDLVNNVRNAIQASFATVTITGGSFSNNGGNAIDLVDGVPVNISGVTIENNGGFGVRTTGQGNAILNITDSIISGNAGSGIECSFCVQMTLDTVTVTNNGSLTTPDSAGVDDNVTRGVFMLVQHEVARIPMLLTIRDSVIDGNKTTGRGAGVYVHDFALRSDSEFGLVLPSVTPPTITIANTSISNNIAERTVGDIGGPAGGGLWVALGFVTISENSRITGNRAGALGFLSSASGGGINVTELDPINDTTTLTIADSTVSGNFANASGGGIYYSGAGPVTITDSSISNNEASFDAGGGMLIQEADLAMTRTTVADNIGFVGAGVTLGVPTGTSAKQFQIIDSTISGNSAIFPLTGGGGLLGFANNPATTLNINNSTISGNTASGSGDGLSLFGPIAVSIEHSTIVENASGGGNSILISDGSLSIAKSVLSAGAGGVNCLLSDTSVSSEGFTVADDTTCSLGDIDTIITGDPGLGPLADNSGPTLTHLPDPASPVAGVVPVGSCTQPADQRGVLRPQGSNCEAGSVEIEEVPGGPLPIMGTPGDDVLFGTSANDVILGGGGNDFIIGGGGNDIIRGGTGRDIIFAGPGADYVEGGAGNDLIFGGGGNDEIKGDAGNDVLIGGPGTNMIDGGLGTDFCRPRRSTNTACER